MAAFRRRTAFLPLTIGLFTSATILAPIAAAERTVDGVEVAHPAGLRIEARDAAVGRQPQPVSIVDEDVVDAEIGEIETRRRFEEADARRLGGRIGLQAQQAATVARRPDPILTIANEAGGRRRPLTLENLDAPSSSAASQARSHPTSGDAAGR